MNATVESIRPLERIEFVVNGKVVMKAEPANLKTTEGTFSTISRSRIPIDGTSWVAMRVFEENGGRRNLFAHSSPVFVEVAGKPLRPRREEIEYLIGRVKEEIVRNEGLISEEAMEEYRQALRAYEAKRN